MSAAIYDHVCDPTSMFQDTFSLSEFIMGQQEEDEIASFPPIVDNKDGIKEEFIESEEEYQEQVSLSDASHDVTMPLAYSPCSYVRPSAMPGSPASCSSGCSATSPTGYQPPPIAYPMGQSRFLSGSITDTTLPYAVYMGYRSRERKRDEELPYDEREKRRVRRERNKMAALRCRTRRRERIETLEKETAELEEQNNEVENEISSLQKQLHQLEKILRDHQCPHGLTD